MMKTHAGILSVSLFLLPFLPLAAAEPFEFLVMGCMPYHMPEDAQRFENIIRSVNEAAPAFAVHCGDTKFGRTPCDDPAYEQIKSWFDRIEPPFAYVPGDNEWTDCHTDAAGGFDPLERLNLVRRLFFSEPRSLGVRKIDYTSQRTQPPFSMFVEHNRWEHQGVLFTTLHVVGSNNNRREDDPAAMAEFQARDQASIAWMREAFAEAKTGGHKALVLFMQANPFHETKRSDPRDTGFENIVPALRDETQAFARPVYLVHSDSHYFRVDKPLTSTSGRMLENFTRIETFGGLNLHLVRIHVDPDSPEPLRATPWMIEANKVDTSSPLPAANKGKSKDP